jgi:hypothetical protein
LSNHATPVGTDVEKHGLADAQESCRIVWSPLAADHCVVLMP